jgi:hypothetical protein
VEVVRTVAAVEPPRGEREPVPFRLPQHVRRRPRRSSWVALVVVVVVAVAAVHGTQALRTLRPRTDRELAPFTSRREAQREAPRPLSLAAAWGMQAP